MKAKHPGSANCSPPPVFLEGRPAEDVPAALRDMEEYCRTLQAELIRARRMDTLGMLAAGIAHDLNNTLSGILGHAELAKIQIASNRDPRQCVEECIKAACRARDLVRQILEFGRGHNGRHGSFDPGPVIRELIGFLRAVLPASIRIVVNVEDDLGNIPAEPTVIYQVLMNLCTNAADAMRETGGVLDVSCRNVTVAEKDPEPPPELNPGPYVRLTVRDTGNGMAPEVLQKIFDPYFTTKESGRGTGLGLTVVQAFVQRLSGAIKVASEPGSGSTFDIYLPRVNSVV